jgi:hypothetical protein
VASYVIGLDLGQACDYTALAVLEIPPWPAPVPSPAPKRVYSLRHLHRYPLQTPYTVIAAEVAKLTHSEKLTGQVSLVVDCTGVGRPVTELVQQQKIRGGLYPVTITAGHQVTRDQDGGFRAPKKDLCGSLLMLWQAERLLIAQKIPFADVLVKEVSNFETKITLAGSEIFGTWREGQHDDIILAVSLACWWTINNDGPPWIVSKTVTDSLILQLFRKIGFPPGWTDPEDDGPDDPPGTTTLFRAH